MTEARDLVLPNGYADLVGELTNRVRAARTHAEEGIPGVTARPSDGPKRRTQSVPWPLKTTERHEDHRCRTSDIRPWSNMS
jgi:hypothetical protein